MPKSRRASVFAELLRDKGKAIAMEPGKSPDVEGDTLKDISELDRITFVMKSGQVFKHVKGK